MKLSILIPVMLLGALVTPAAAQQSHSGSMSGMQMQGMQGGNMSGGNMEKMTAAQREYHAVMQKMDRSMMQGMMDPDPGMSWVKQMIAHHEGAVEMSDIALKYSKDSDILNEARKTKEQNEKDAKELRAKLKKDQKSD